MFPSLYNWRKEGFLPCCDWRCGFTWCHFTVVTRGRVEAVPSVSPEKHQSHRPLARPAAWTQEDQSYSRAMRMGLRLIEKYCSASLTWDCIAGHHSWPWTPWDFTTQSFNNVDGTPTLSALTLQTAVTPPRFSEGPRTFCCIAAPFPQLTSYKGCLPFQCCWPIEMIPFHLSWAFHFSSLPLARFSLLFT